MHVVIILAVSLLVAFWLWLDHQQRLAGKASPEQEQALAEALEQVRRLEAAQERLTQRVEHLEAIVTTEAFDRAREEARIEQPEEAARLGRRLRS